ncbi:hypothetical protein ONS96_008343 [Cadophora gregata f. sp. sojae]|nr:hypothetical protein ONS96_008343 [Cadophora gregata f. sp. sojae]
MHHDLFVALMGVTGAGKSTFISHCTEENVGVGDGLKSCTQEVRVFKCNYSPTVTIHLVDTPGFDDSDRKDTVVLKEIAAWLTYSYTQKVRLSGILYLHRISDPRMQGSAKLNLSAFIKLCGPEALKKVVLATTMWEALKEDSDGARREKELMETPEFWGWMMSHGSQVRRHQNNRQSAMELLSMFVPESATAQPEFVTLEIQVEMADNQVSLDKTKAGEQLAGVFAKEKEELTKELEDVRAMMKSAQEERDLELAKLLQEQQNEMDRRVARLQEERQQLQITMEKLHAEKMARLEETLTEQRATTEKISQSLEEIEKRRMREEWEAKIEKTRREEEKQEHQRKIEELTRKLSDTTVPPATTSPVSATHSKPNDANSKPGKGKKKSAKNNESSKNNDSSNAPRMLSLSSLGLETMNKVLFSPDGRYVAILAHGWRSLFVLKIDDDKSVREKIWDRTFSHSETRILAFSQGGSYLATGADDGDICVFQLDRSNPLRNYYIHWQFYEDRILSLMFTTVKLDLSIVVGMIPKAAKKGMFGSKTPKPYVTVFKLQSSADGKVYPSSMFQADNACLSPDNTLLATADETQLRMYTRAFEKKIPTYNYLKMQSCRSLGLNFASSNRVWAFYRPNDGWQDEYLLWDGSTECPTAPNWGVVNFKSSHIAGSKDGRFVAFGTDDPTLKDGGSTYVKDILKHDATPAILEVSGLTKPLGMAFVGTEDKLAVAFADKIVIWDKVHWDK